MLLRKLPYFRALRADISLIFQLFSHKLTLGESRQQEVGCVRYFVVMSYAYAHPRTPSVLAVLMPLRPDRRLTIARSVVQRNKQVAVRGCVNKRSRSLNSVVSAVSSFYAHHTYRSTIQLLTSWKEGTYLETVSTDTYKWSLAVARETDDNPSVASIAGIAGRGTSQVRALFLSSLLRQHSRSY